MQISVFCGNCDHVPVMLCCLEDGEKTRCISCGVYMHDAILEEDFDEDYCHGCESGVDCADAHSKKCQVMLEKKSPVQVMRRMERCFEKEQEESEDDEYYCLGCESGVDCASAHTERCQILFHLYKLDRSSFPISL